MGLQRHKPFHHRSRQRLIRKFETEISLISYLKYRIILDRMVIFEKDKNTIKTGVKIRTVTHFMRHAIKPLLLIT